LIEELEGKLDSFDFAERKEALLELCERVESGQIILPEANKGVNLHCHSFFSYNNYGYSPSKFAWLARKRGLAVAGVVDFDVLDGLEEFLDACRMVGLRGCVGLETRVFVPEFAEKVINSLGEPGISYDMGIGFPGASMEAEQQEFLKGLGETATLRNIDLTGRVNDYLSPVVLDYEKDVLILTPSGNATERHICLGYARKAKEVLGTGEELIRFWSEKLGIDSASLDLPEGQKLLDVIRAKTMKRGGVGYIQSDKGSFPLMADMNRFVEAAGGIPTMTWLDGTSEAEQSIEELVEVVMSTGAAAINIIPDRNYKPGVKDKKLENLYEVVELAEKLSLPIVVGTEMNSPGQKFVDGFETDELSPLLPIFLKGAYIVYGHSVLQRQCGLGYKSDWAKRNFGSTSEKNGFFEEVGRLLEPQQEDKAGDFSVSMSSDEILNKLSG
jgi:hypothetical protein